MGPEDTTDTTDEADATPTVQPRVSTRRRASRAAGPASEVVGAAVDIPKAAMSSAQPKAIPRQGKPAGQPLGRPLGPPPRRQPSWVAVFLSATALLVVLAALLTAGVVLLAVQHGRQDAELAREQRFVDTASQTVVNMFSYTQNTIDESVDRFVGGISGPLRDLMAQGNNVDNLKAIFRDTQATSEAVINGAALEKIDPIANNASVLVAVRVTVTDIDGVNAPSKPYRLRVIVHEDDDGRMTGYDLKYPDGGN